MAINLVFNVQPSLSGNFEVLDEGGAHAFTSNLNFVEEVFIREVAFTDKVVTLRYWDGSAATYQRGARPIVTDAVNGQRYQPVVKTTTDGARLSYAVALDGLGRGYIVR